MRVRKETLDEETNLSLKVLALSIFLALGVIGGTVAYKNAGVNHVLVEGNDYSNGGGGG
ncbi:MAG: hypothetical protein R2865_12350 [Deinococcales bacterium]